MEKLLKVYEERFGVATKKSEIDVRKMMDEIARKCWLNIPGWRVEVTTSNKTFIFEGTVYEDMYESFTADTNVYEVVDGKEVVIRTIDAHSVAPYRKETVEKGSVDEVISIWDAISDEYVFIKNLR